MTEVMRWKLKGFVPGVEGVSKALFQPWVVQAEDFDNATRLFLDAAERCVAAERREKELQHLLTAVDERADTATSLIQRIVANFDTEIEFHEDVEPNDLEHDQVLTEMREFLAGNKPAAQTQGEPVAWLNVATGHVTTSAAVVMDWDDEKEQVQSLYAEQPAPVAVVTDGWQMVPVEPTDDMIVAFAEAWYSKHQTIDDPDMLDAYRDMLVTAPKHPQIL